MFAQLAPTPVDLIVLPEAALTGYFLEGAVYELALDAPSDGAPARRGLARAAARPAPVDVVCGFYENAGGTFHNSALYARVGEPDGPHVVHVHRKMFLPTYGVFDEERFLTRGRRLSVFDTPFGRTAMLICEDAWHTITADRRGAQGRAPDHHAERVARARPGQRGRRARERRALESVLASIAAEHGIYVLYAGLTGFEGGKGCLGLDQRLLAARRAARGGRAARRLHRARCGWSATRSTWPARRCRCWATSRRCCPTSGSTTRSR